MDTEVTDRHRRADARRNRERVLAAASEMLAESGLKAPMEEIARRAGVGVGTVCRNFPTKKDIVDAVLVDLYETLLQDALDGLANPDAGEAFWIAQVRSVYRVACTCTRPLATRRAASAILFSTCCMVPETTISRG